PPPRSDRLVRDEPTSPEHELQGDERMYTGEPVQTKTGTRRPRQMNVGPDNMEGGEWPDPDAPAAPGAIGWEGRGDRSPEPVKWDAWFRMFDSYELAVLFRDGEDDDWDRASVEFVRRSQSSAASLQRSRTNPSCAIPTDPYSARRAAPGVRRSTICAGAIA